MRIGHYFAGAGLLVLPFVFSAHGEAMREPKTRALILMAGLYLSLKLSQKINLALGCGSALFFLSAFFRSVVFPFSEVATFAAALLSCFWVAHSTKDHIERGFKVFEFSGLLAASYALLLQYTEMDPLLVPVEGHTMKEITAFFGQPTLYGPYAVACFASALFFGRHLLALLLFLPIPIIHSSFTYLSLAAVLSLYGLRRFGPRRVGLVAILGLTLFLGASKIWPKKMAGILDDSGRYKLWAATFMLAERYPLLGYGAGSFRLVFPIFQDKELRKANGIEDMAQTEEMRQFFRDMNDLQNQHGIFLHPHNELMNVFFAFGMLGVVAAFWWVSSFFFSWLALPDDDFAWALGAVFLCFISNGLGNIVLTLIPQALLPLWSFVAVTTFKDEDILEKDAYRARG